MKSKLLMCSLATLLLLQGCTNSPTPSTGNQESNSGQSSDQTDADSQNLDDDLDLGGTAVKGTDVSLNDYSGNILINQGGTYTVSGNLNGTLIVDASKQEVTLNLENVNIDASAPAIFIRHASSVTINVTGDCVLTSANTEYTDELNATLYSKADLILSGDGNLAITSEQSHGIKAKDTFTMNSGNVTIQAAQDGIHINEQGEFQQGTLTVNAQDDGISSETDLIFAGTDCTVNSTSDCLKAENALNISDGTFVLNSSQTEGIEGKQSVEITGGDLSVSAYDDCINAGSSLSIQGGTIRVYSMTNDAIDSNGTLQFGGGTITALARQTPEGAFDVDNTPFIIQKGTILGIGPAACVPTQADQNVLLVAGNGSIDSLELTDSQGQVIVSFTRADNETLSTQNTITISSPNLMSGDTVTLSVNGKIIDSIIIEEGVTEYGNVQVMGGPGGKGGMQNGQAGGPEQMSPPPDAELNPPIKSK